MKKYIAVSVVLCLLFVGAVAYISFDKRGQEEPAPEISEAPAEEEVGAVEELEPIQTLDFKAMKALYDDDMVVMTISGEDVTWGEYFYMLYANAQDILSQFDYYRTYFGMTMKWSDSMSDDPEDTFAAYVVNGIDEYLTQFKTIVSFGKENGVELSQEHMDVLSEQLKSDIEAICGEGADEEDFNAYLDGIFLSRKMYDEMNLVNLYYQENFKQIYGANGEKIKDKEAMEYLTDGGFMHADHILLKTVDESYQPLEESVVAEKKAQAEDIAEELAAVEDAEERIALFYELKEEYTDDTGAAYYPEGYTFTTGTMVSSFEDGHNSLADNEVSGVIESEYGYHIMLRLPLDPDAIIEYSEAGTALSARGLLANNNYGKDLQAHHEKMEIVYVEGFEKPDVLKYIIEE